MPSSSRKQHRSQHSSQASADFKSKRTHNHSHTSSVSSVHKVATSPTYSTADDAGEVAAAQPHDEDGHGNLADELAEALEEEHEGDIDDGKSSTLSEISPSPSKHETRFALTSGSDKPNASRASDVESDKAYLDTGSTDSEPSDDFTFLDLHAIALNSIVKRFEVDSSGDPKDSSVHLAKSLRDLPAQSAIENGTSRLITTHSALTSHVANQTRALQTLVHPLISPFVASPTEEDIDELVPLLANLIAAVPSQGAQCLTALNLLHSLTIDLGQTLTYLSDSIYMMRQNLSLAGRKLRTVAEMLDEVKREAAVREESMRWIERGRWDRKLVDRQCGHVCGEVIGGFEEILASVFQDTKARIRSASGHLK